MVTLLAKIFIKDSEDKIKQREAYGMLCGVIGILFNVLLFIGKFLAGTLSNSIAITADAFNNLSDAGSSIVTLLGFKLAGAKPDTEHPFGHGRIEYVSGLVVAAAILLMGYELVRDSIGKIMHPEETEFTLLVAVILIASILVKLYMAYYNRAIGKKLDSAAMKAVATDSLSDTAATTVVLLASIFTHFTGIKIDGYCGLVVGLLVGYAGFDAARETLNPLLGQPPAHEFVEKIDEIVMSHSEVCGMHDLIVHDYGPGRQMISLHAEVPAEGKTGKTVFDVTDIGNMTLHIGANEHQNMDVRIQEISCETLYIDDLDVTTVTGADRAISALDDAIAMVSDARSKIGAYENRLEYATSSLDTFEENMTDAMSRLTDVDMAEEMTNYTQYNVLQQAGVSVLSQANDLPQNVLSLLQ